MNDTKYIGLDVTRQRAILVGSTGFCGNASQRPSSNLFTQHLIHKTVLSLIAWVLFGILLIGRIRYGWRGRSAVHWALSGFGFLAVAYFGAKFVLETLLGRHWG